MTQQTADNPGVIIFPPLLFAGALVIGLGLEWLVPSHPFPKTVARTLGAVVMIAGIALARWGQSTMRRAGTNVNPREPALAIVVDGPFRYTRNPLYIALTGLYVGIALLFDSCWPLLLLLAVLPLVNVGIVRREERYLEAKFGATYLAYKSRVRRWL